MVGGAKVLEAVVLVAAAKAARAPQGVSPASVKRLPAQGPVGPAELAGGAGRAHRQSQLVFEGDAEVLVWHLSRFSLLDNGRFQDPPGPPPGPPGTPPGPPPGTPPSLQAGEGSK